MNELTAIGIDIDGNNNEKKIVDVKLFFFYRDLTELILPEGVEIVVCYGNKITHLDLPDSVSLIWADKKVIGLEEYIGKID